MLTKTTEAMHQNAVGLDQAPLTEAALHLADGQIAAATVVRTALENISNAAEQMALTIQSGGRLHYVAAGSSGLMAAADAQELGGTFSIPAKQLEIHMAGGLPTGVEMPGDTEDDTSALSAALASLGPQDTMIAVSASGSTPYTVFAANMARSQNVPVVSIANNPKTPLLELATHPILLETPPEILSGSTRMGAGTAQKIALNMLSTLMAIRLGHVHDGLMVNLYADNAKLRDRALRIVENAAGVSPEDAKRALEQAKGQVKTAIVVAAQNTTPEIATAQLAATNGHLRPILKTKI